MRSYKVKKEAYQLSRYTDRYPFTLLQCLAKKYDFVDNYIEQPNTLQPLNHPPLPSPY